MKKLIEKASVKYSAICRKIHVVTTTTATKHAATLMLLVGVGLISAGVMNVAVAQGDIQDEPITRVIQILLGDLVEGSFGALIMIVAGLVAIIAAAMGAYRAAMAALVVAVGAFILRAFVSAFFPNVEIGTATN
jgi:hypothetical protein